MTIDEPVGPFINAAALCERIIQESKEDGDFLSAIRFIETVAVVAQYYAERSTTLGVEDMPPFPVPLQLLVMMKALPPDGQEVPFKVHLRQPQGQRKENLFNTNLIGSGATRGMNLRLNLEFRFTQAGMHWFEIECMGKVLTQVPLLVSFEINRLPQSSEAHAG